MMRDLLLYTFTIDAPGNIENKGDAAILSGNIFAINKEFPGSKIIILNRNAEELRDLLPKNIDVHYRMFDDVMMKKIPSFLKLLEIIAKSFMYLLWMRSNKIPIDERARIIFNIYKKSDFIIYTGGGYLGGPYRSINILIPIYLAKKLGKNVCLTGITIEKPKNKIIKSLIKFVLNKVEFITLREPLSFDVIESLKIKTPKYLTADYALLLGNESKDLGANMLDKEGITNNKKIKIGISMKEIPKSEISNIEFELYKKKLATAVEMILNKLDAIIVFFPIDVSSLQDDRKTANSVMKIVEKRFHKRIFTLNGDYQIEQIKAMIGSMDVFIATRFHSTVFAVSMGVPTISLPYMQKNLGFMKMLSLEKWILPFKTFSPTQLADLTVEIFKQGDKVKKIMEKNITKLKDSAVANVKYVKKFLD